MALTFGEVRNLVAQYAGRGGKCATADQTAAFAREVLEHLLFSGQYGAIRHFCFITQKGCFTAPPELETPLKVRIDSTVANVWSKWGTFKSVNSDTGFTDTDRNCYPIGKIFKEEANLSPTHYMVPPGGSLIGVVGTCEEDEDAELIIKGEDPTGREIHSFKGEHEDSGKESEQIVGERIRIRKDQLRVGNIIFGNVSHVIKPKTKGYVQLWAVNPNNFNQRQFLADYSPLEQTPLYRRFTAVSSHCKDTTHISVLARIRLKEAYTDNDIVPFSSIIPIQIAAQRLQAEANNDIQTAGYKKEVLKEFIENESAYKTTRPGGPLDVFHPLSAGSIKNIM